MVQGPSTRQNASKKSAAESGAARIRVKKPVLRVTSAVSINVPPIAAANSPLSGRNRTASPASKPVATHQLSAFLRTLALNANVAVSTIAAVRKFVSTSDRLVG